jgi:hypothetical protein
MEQLIVGLIEQHPEYHRVLLDPDSIDRDWPVDDGTVNPFLHLSMHLGLIEQVQTDRPAGIRAIYRSLSAVHGDSHQAEHRMMECLGSALWQAQRNGAPPDEQTYLRCLKDLLESGAA